MRAADLQQPGGGLHVEFIAVKGFERPEDKLRGEATGELRLLFSRTSGPPKAIPAGPVAGRNRLGERVPALEKKLTRAKP